MIPSPPQTRADPDRASAHPFLDPEFDDHHPELVRSFYRYFLSLRDDAAYDTALDRLLNPPGGGRSAESNRIAAAYYLNEASRYLEALLELLPRRRRLWLRADRRVAETRDVRELFGLIFESPDPRVVFEARRKLFLAKLFFDVDHTWEVQRGERHRSFFAELLEREIFGYTVERRDVDLAFDIAADGVGIDYRVGSPLPNEEFWRFHLRELNFLQDGRPVRVHVYFYSCRSKREVLPYTYVRGQKIYQIEAREKWSGLSLRRDASIVSKMLRKGVADPRQIPDIVGAMFIVKDLVEVETLKEALFDILGGPMRIRHVVDTLNRPADRELLNRQSGAGYEVYKGDLEVLYRPDDATPPYGFTVELQIYTLEGYLRTIHTRHYASHQRLKRRQFLEGIVPRLWPVEIYRGR
jgi:hypothetical protein